MQENGTRWKTKLSILDKRIKAFIKGYRQNIAIFGDDKEELSYLLENYLRSNTPEGISCIHATTSYTNQKDFFKSVAISLLSKNNQSTDTLDNLINQNNSEMPSTVNFIKKTLKKKNIVFLDILELINKFLQEKQENCLFIIEEFLGLKKLFPDSFNEFSKFLILQRNCMVVLTSSSSKEAERIISSELNLLFGNFEKILLNETSFFDNYFYLKQSLEPLCPPPLFISFFVNILGNNILSYDLMIKTIRSNYQPDEKGIVNILEKSLYSRESYFFQKFIKNIELIEKMFKDHTSVINILLSLSGGYLRKKELLSLNIAGAKDLSNKLSKLSELNYIINYGNVYKIKDPLFSLWLSQVFKIYFFPPLSNPVKRKELWKLNMAEEICIFKEDFLKDKVRKVLELISSFKDDSLKIGKNKYKLPLVNRTKILSYPQKDLHILIGEGKEIIFAGIKETNATDSDIFNFIDHGRGIKGKGVKKIFISLDRLTNTAKVVAKNHKLIVWDANEINHLMRVYNKSLISLDSVPENRLNAQFAE